MDIYKSLNISIGTVTRISQMLKFVLVSELEPKKWVFGSGGWKKRNIDFLLPQGVYFLEKHGELSELVAFAQKLRYFTDQNGPKAGTHENRF